MSALHLCRVHGELSLAAANLRATIALHQESLPPDALEALKSVASSQTEWLEELSSTTGPAEPLSPDALSAISIDSSPVASPRRAESSRSPFASSTPPDIEGSEQWRSKMLLRLQRYLNKKLENEHAKLASHTRAAEAADFTGRQIKCDLKKVDAALQQLIDGPSSPTTTRSATSTNSAGSAVATTPPSSVAALPKRAPVSPLEAIIRDASTVASTSATNAALATAAEAHSSFAAVRGKSPPNSGTGRPVVTRKSALFRDDDNTSSLPTPRVLELEEEVAHQEEVLAESRKLLATPPPPPFTAASSLDKTPLDEEEDDEEDLVSPGTVMHVDRLMAKISAGPVGGSPWEDDAWEMGPGQLEEISLASRPTSRCGAEIAACTSQPSSRSPSRCGMEIGLGGSRPASRCASRCGGESEVSAAATEEKRLTPELESPSSREPTPPPPEAPEGSPFSPCWGARVSPAADPIGVTPAESEPSSPRESTSNSSKARTMAQQFLEYSSENKKMAKEQQQEAEVLASPPAVPPPVPPPAMAKPAAEASAERSEMAVAAALGVSPERKPLTTAARLQAELLSTLDRLRQAEENMRDGSTTWLENVRDGSLSSASPASNASPSTTQQSPVANRDALNESPAVGSMLFSRPEGNTPSTKDRPLDEASDREEYVELADDASNAGGEGEEGPSARRRSNHQAATTGRILPEASGSSSVIKATASMPPHRPRRPPPRRRRKPMRRTSRRCARWRRRARRGRRRRRCGRRRPTR